MMSLSSRALAVACVLLVSMAVSVSAHGWLSTPSSRQDQCHKGLVKNCGQVQYEPQSVEAVKGKMTCNGDVPLWAQLADESMPWVVQPVGKGVNKFTWTQTAPHIAANWVYYIGNTKIGEFLGTANTQHCLDLSAYTGRQKILAVWNIADTVNAFYSCVDVDVGAGPVDTSCVGGGANTFTPVTNTGCTSTTTLKSYVVAAGDTMNAIAAANGLTLAKLVEANPYIPDINRIEVGQSVIIPSTSSITCTGNPTPVVVTSTGGIVQQLRSSSASRAPACTSGVKSYTVKTGDTFGSIAQANGLTVSAVVQANANLITTGTVLNLPSGSKTSCAVGCSTKASTTTYTVVSGDTMDKIAVAKGVTLAGLISVNPQVTNKELINIGQQLFVPVYTTTC